MTSVDIPAIFSALQGTNAAQDKPAQVWSVPASVGSDLARGTTLSTIQQLWPSLEETQKLNVLLGIAHAGAQKVEDKQAARQIGRLAATDTSSTWVRTLGGLIGDVGVNGRLRALGDLEETVREELELAIGQVADAVARGGLKLTTVEMECVAEPVGPTRNVYGVRGNDDLFGEEESGAVSMNVRPDKVVDHDERRSRLEMFCDSAANPGSGDAGAPSGLGIDAGRAPAGRHDPRLGPAMRPGAGRGAGHAMRPGNSAGMGIGTRPGGGAGMPPGARPGVGPGVRPAGILRRSSGPGAGSGASFLINRRQGPANAALPAAASITSSVGAGAAGTKRVDLNEIQQSMAPINAREQQLQKNRDELKEARIIRDQGRKAVAEERKLKRQQESEEKKAAREAKRICSSSQTSSRRPSRALSNDGEESGEAESSDDEAPLSAQVLGMEEPATEPVSKEYLEFTGTDPQVQAVYTNTNILSDVDRLRMFCFFTSRQMPEGTGADLEIVLNEQTISDPTRPGTTCTELMVFIANIPRGEWRKVRRIRRQ
ncbi:hypothetical protein BX661DRAFT_71733 [Kickxella alabastrina]|uniref:uncharacterized protein n=1 Tax=Kickxella alabastrina TaxID=61397 RepID=UPI00221FCD75|nr:uncharacterized protein BX661DRAFT_71733 [Kickxella alabastrina]KAI7833241.1 hypothetical protein BX661DRAFT_71733 [Kickxella alabastrina]KAJ1940635.1 hypothetical protein GGF37_003889 [Kickxella alabastrina]